MNLSLDSVDPEEKPLVLEVRDLSVSYGKVEAVHHINLKINKGEMEYLDMHLSQVAVRVDGAATGVWRNHLLRQDAGRRSPGRKTRTPGNDAGPRKA